MSFLEIYLQDHYAGSTGGLEIAKRTAKANGGTEFGGPLAELDVWLAPYRRLWNDSLDALGRHLDRMPTAATPTPSTASGAP